MSMGPYTGKSSPRVSITDKGPGENYWCKHYVKGLFNDHERELLSTELWEVRKEFIPQGFDISRSHTKQTEENRRHFVRTIYYPNYTHLYHQGMLMVPEPLLSHNFIWGSLAYVTFPGSSVHIYQRKIIEEALKTLKSPTECTQYLRRVPSKFTKGRTYGFFVLPIEKMLATKLDDLRIEILGTKDFRTYCPDGVSDKAMKDIPQNWIFPDEPAQPKPKGDSPW